MSTFTLQMYYMYYSVNVHSLQTITVMYSLGCYKSNICFCDKLSYIKIDMGNDCYFIKDVRQSFKHLGYFFSEWKKMELVN